MIQLDNAVSRYNKIILDELKNAGIRCWIAGGCLRDYFMGIPIKTDIDLFFPDDENRKKCVNYFKTAEANIVWESENGMKLKHKGKTYDIIKHYFPDPQATIDAFDFTVSMFAVDNIAVYSAPTAFMDLAKRQLMINKIMFPASTMSRAFRYYTKGFKMCIGEMAKLVKSIQDMPKLEEVTEQVQGQEPISQPINMFIGID